jgi:pantoate--beta-alanine ligase
MQRMAPGWRRAGVPVGLVPTMGYLHEGHLSLVRRARQLVGPKGQMVVSIYVNPTQFAPTEDFSRYPRDLTRDAKLCRGEGVDVIFAPTDQQMYPRGSGADFSTFVAEEGLSRLMEGRSRPRHFRGVTTVVAKLFNIAGPCAAFFGEKDYQQLAIVRRMARDLDFPVQVVGCPIVREPDGVALSSRNVYLTPAEREAAPVLHRALQAGAASILAGERSGAAVRRLMSDIVGAEPLARLDYAEVVRADSLDPVGELTADQEIRLLVAAKLGAPRLLDNLGVRVPGNGSE